MIENLKRFREPLAWLAIALTLLGMGLTVWRLVAVWSTGTVAEAFQDVSGNWLNTPLMLLVVVIVLSCSLVTPAVGRAMLLARIAAGVLAAGVLLTLVSVLMGMWASAAVAVVLDFLGGLMDVAIKTILAATLWIFLRGVKAGRIETAPTTSPMPSIDTEAGASADLDSSKADSTQASTTWTRDTAAGTVWWTANDAAAGEPGKDKMPEAPESEGSERPSDGP